ncbi:uncharacterized protein LOC122500854 [Leptopilina heterotoma]|uniref:uncharacterized protein LOC122500854 n=1 Tax=Leptopilina heterotoma TaxID=63436 RepID=UPI001CA82D87|nr:uncharacterized protein LOC122500854 [Leptopilina heterotoma]
MKNLNRSLTLILISAGIIVSALRFIEPLDGIIRSKYGVGLGDLKPKCDSKGPSLHNELVDLQSQESEIRSQLTGALIAKNKAEGRLTDPEFKQWMQDNCLSNATLITISQVAIDKAQLCVDPNQRLQGAEVDKAKEELLQRLCGAVSLSAKWVIMNNL